jgi:nicotinamidase-related amidase
LGSPLKKAHGIKTVIVTGMSAQDAVVGTGSGAAQRGYKVIVPVDGMSAEDPYRMDQNRRSRAKKVSSRGGAALASAARRLPLGRLTRGQAG